MRKYFIFVVFLFSGCSGWSEEAAFNRAVRAVDPTARRIRWMDWEPPYILEGQIVDMALPDGAQGGTCLLLIASTNAARGKQILDLRVDQLNETISKGWWSWPNAMAVFMVPEDRLYNVSVLVTSRHGHGEVSLSAYEVRRRACKSTWSYD